MSASRPPSPSPDLPRASRPDRTELDRLFSLAYEELRLLAATVRGGDPSETLNPTALVNEVYLKLAGSLRLTPDSLVHFKRIAARAMRQVLVEAARRRKALKRGGDYVFVALDEAIGGGTGTAEEVVQLHDALEKLAQIRPRLAQVVEYRFFGGFDLVETAELVGVSQATVVRDWRTARAWLAKRLGPGASGGSPAPPEPGGRGAREAKPERKGRLDEDAKPEGRT